jgi:hypothetical protein
VPRSAAAHGRWRLRCRCSGSPSPDGRLCRPVLCRRGWPRARTGCSMSLVPQACGAGAALWLERAGALERWMRIRRRWFACLMPLRAAWCLLALWPVALALSHGGATGAGSGCRGRLLGRFAWTGCACRTEAGARLLLDFLSAPAACPSPPGPTPLSPVIGAGLASRSAWCLPSSAATSASFQPWHRRVPFCLSTVACAAGDRRSPCCLGLESGPRPRRGPGSTASRQLGSGSRAVGGLGAECSAGGAPGCAVALVLAIGALPQHTRTTRRTVLTFAQTLQAWEQGGFPASALMAWPSGAAGCGRMRRASTFVLRLARAARVAKNYNALMTSSPNAPAPSSPPSPYFERRSPFASTSASNGEASCSQHRAQDAFDHGKRAVRGGRLEAAPVACGSIRQGCLDRCCGGPGCSGALTQRAFGTPMSTRPTWTRSFGFPLARRPGGPPFGAASQCGAAMVCGFDVPLLT